MPPFQLPPLPPRHEHWERRLVQWAKPLIGQSHAWGTRDCFALVVDGVAAITGRPLPVPSEFRQYMDAAGATRTIRAVIERYGSMGDALVACGLAPIGEVHRATTGDVLCWDGDLPAFGIVVGRHLVTSDATIGVHMVPLHLRFDDADARVYRVPSGAAMRTRS